MIINVVSLYNIGEMKMDMSDVYPKILNPELL